MSFNAFDLKNDGKKRIIGSGNLVASCCLSLNWLNISSVFEGGPHMSLWFINKARMIHQRMSYSALYITICLLLSIILCSLLRTCI